MFRIFNIPIKNIDPGLVTSAVLKIIPAETAKALIFLAPSHMESPMKTTVFKIEGMQCDHCAKIIKKVIEMEAGVQMAAVSFEERQARVLYDPQIAAEDRLIAAIQKPGFKVVGRE